METIEKNDELSSKNIDVILDLKKYFFPNSNDKALSLPEKYEKIQKYAEMLKEFHSNGKIYDNLEEFPLIMKNYITSEGPMDYRLDNYMLNILTLCFLNDIKADEILEKVEEILVDFYNNKPDMDHMLGLTDCIDCIDIGYSLVNPKIADGRLLIDYINKTKSK